MTENPIYHVLKVKQDVCVGCSHCMRVCPTEAIRVRSGIARINQQLCIDCGECYRVCPTHAIYAQQDDLNLIHQYQHSVALVPSVLIGQFPGEIKTTQIYNALLEIGFSDVYEVEHGVEFMNEAYVNYLENNKENKPVISSFCPAIIRLIQVNYPALLDNIMRIKTPVDIAAAFYRKKMTDSGLNPEQIGIFYISPCSAKIAAIKSPVGETGSEINGVINLNTIFGRIMRTITIQKPENLTPISTRLSEKGVLWSLTNGEAAHAGGRSLAVDGVHNAIDFLEKLENEEIRGLDFVEIRACDESCAGGILNVTNRFLVVERLKNRAKIYKNRELRDPRRYADANYPKYKAYLNQRISLEKIEPRRVFQLDTDMGRAMEKLKTTQRLLKYLPGFDCGGCGSPSCKALAEDIVKGDATLSYCIFVQRIMEKQHNLSPERAFGIIEKIWGKNRLEMNFKLNDIDHDNI